MATSASNSDARHRRRQREAEMMETDVDSISSHGHHRAGIHGQNSAELGTGQHEFRLGNTREFLCMVKNITAMQPEVEKELETLETMINRNACMATESESKEKMRELERQLAELREENTLMKSRVDTYRHDGDIHVGKGNSDDKLRATEHLNRQLKEEVMNLQQQNKEIEQKLKESQETLRLTMDQLQQERNENQESMSEVQDKCTNYIKKQKQQLKENKETIIALTEVKGHLNQMIDSKESTIQEQKKMLESERKELDETKSRLSKMMGNQMKDGNPYIADLSDKNRPTKVADLYTELYDNEWTDAFDVLQSSAYRKEEKDIAKQLLDILLDINTFCKEEVERQTNRIKQALLVGGQGDQLNPRILQELKQFQRSSSDCSLQGVYQKYTDPNKKRSLTVTANASKVPEFVIKCIEVCWIMAMQDPPLEFRTETQSFGVFDRDEYKAYTKLGQFIDFVVWPPLLLHKGGPLLAKGVAQGYGTQQGSMKSPSVKSKETSFPNEPKQAWASSTGQTGSYPSTSVGVTYPQSSTASQSVASSGATSSQYEQTTVTPTSYPRTAVPLTQYQPIPTHLTNTRTPAEPLTTAQAHIAYQMQALAMNQNQNTNFSYPRQPGSLSSGNVMGQSYDSRMAHGARGRQSGTSGYGIGYPYNYPYQ